MLSVEIHSADESTSNDVYVDQHHQQDGKEQLVPWESKFKKLIQDIKTPTSYLISLS